MSAISVREISKSYGPNKVLENISFNIDKGEVVGLLGKNGEGKSTLFKILSTCTTPCKGVVYMGGFDTQKQALKAQKKIGYLPEKNPLYLNSYPKEFLQFLAKLHNVSKHRIDFVLEQMGLTNHLNQKISTLSKGYKQRVGLAAALLHDPDILLLDEPTTGLDPVQLDDIRRLLKIIGTQKTILLSTHIIQEVNEICNRVLVLNNTKIKADISLKEKQNQLQIRFNTAIDTESLLNIEGIFETKTINETTYECKFYSSYEEVSELLFNYAIRKKLIILEIQKSQLDLEKFFREHI